MFDEIFNYLRTLIVYDANLSMHAISIQKMMQGRNGLHVVKCRFRFQWARQNGATITIAFYHKMFISFAEGNMKTDRLSEYKFPFKSTFLI